MSAKVRSFTYRIANWLLSVRLSVIAAPRMSISPRGSLLLDASSWDLKYKRAQSLSSYMYQYLRLTFSLPSAVKMLCKNYLVALEKPRFKEFYRILNVLCVRLYIQRIFIWIYYKNIFRDTADNEILTSTRTIVQIPRETVPASHFGVSPWAICCLCWSPQPISLGQNWCIIYTFTCGFPDFLRDPPKFL